MAGDGRWAALYDLTAAEVRTLVALSEGLSTKEIHTQHGFSDANVLIHLRNLYAKSGPSRQSALIALVRSFELPLWVPEGRR